MGTKSLDSRVIADKVLRSVHLNLGCLKTLQLTRNQNSTEDINSSYRRLCLLLHPDKHNGDAVYLQAFQAVNLAHKEALATISQVKPHRLLDEQPTNPKPAAGRSKWTLFTHATAPPSPPQHHQQQPPKTAEEPTILTTNKWADKSRQVKARLLQESAAVNLQVSSSAPLINTNNNNNDDNNKESRSLVTAKETSKRRKSRRATEKMRTRTTTATKTNESVSSAIDGVKKRKSSNNTVVPPPPPVVTTSTSSKWDKPFTNFMYINTTVDVKNIEKEEEEDVMAVDSAAADDDSSGGIETDDEDSDSWDDSDDSSSEENHVNTGKKRRKNDDNEKEEEGGEEQAREEKKTVELFLRLPSLGGHSRGGGRSKQTSLGIRNKKKGLCSM